ncbi:hypothetical protein AB832_06960 [Flavobacteriaceae bacterium (ex Bugula neritina AB1)]|nr:hypothetical protein AB832_06960 [Flavobacteriaceae bacterium (ex Bugula neritina AB1)]
MTKKIVGFTIKIEGQDEITDTTKLLKLFNKQLVLINGNLRKLDKLGEKSFVKLNKELLKTSSSVQRLGGVVQNAFISFEKGSEIVQGLGGGFKTLTGEIKKAGKAAEKEGKQNDNNNKKKKEGIQTEAQRIKQLQKIGELTNEEREELQRLLVEQQKQRLIQRERNNIAKQTAIIQAEQGDTIKSLRAQLSLTSIQWAKLTVSEQDNSEEGKRLTATKKRLTEQLKAIEKATGDNRREVGNYSIALGGLSKVSDSARKGLTRLALRLTVGRSIIEGVSNAIRSVTSGLQELVREGDDTNEVFNEINDSADGLNATLVTVGTRFLNTFGSGIAKIIDNVSFVISVVSNALIDASQSAGIFGTILRGIGELLTNFPAIFGGIVEAAREFASGTARAFSSFSLNAQLAFENFLLFSRGVAGFDTSETEKNIQNLTNELAKNAQGARSLGQAYTDGYNATLRAQEEFNKRSEEEVKIQEQRAKQIERRKKAAQEAEQEAKRIAAEEKRRQEELIKDRANLLEELQQQAQARVDITKDLQQQLIDVQIESIKDETQRATEAEKVRFERLKESREANFKELQAQTAAQEAETLKLFGENSQELLDLQEKNDKELLELSILNDALIEAEEQAHQDALLKIQQDGEAASLEAQRKADEEKQKQTDKANKEALDKQKKADKEAEEQRKQTIEGITSIFNDSFNLIEDLVQIANKAETNRLDQALKNREASISDLNKQLENATGLQKKFLEQQVDQEKKALEEEKKARDKAEKERIQAAKVLALVQAAINGAIAITRAFSDLGPIAGAVAAVGVGAAIGVQIADIASQNFAEGGRVEANGKITQGGNIPTQKNGDNVLAKTNDGQLITVKTGEVILNERQQQLLGGAPVFSSIGVPGFANGGTIPGSVSSAPRVANTMARTDEVIKSLDAKTDAINNRIDRLQVVQDLNNLQDIEDNENTLQTLSTL